MLKGQGDARARLPCRSSADGVYDDHHRARALHGIINLLRCAEFLDTEARQFRAHRRDEGFWIRHALIVLDERRTGAAIGTPVSIGTKVRCTR